MASSQNDNETTSHNMKQPREENMHARIPVADGKASLSQSQRKRSPQRTSSFSEVEKFFLHGLLVDDDVKRSANGINNNNNSSAKGKVFDDSVLFSTMPKKGESSSLNKSLPKSHQKAKRRSTIDLWRAHESGVAPAILKQKGQLVLKSSFNDDELRVSLLSQRQDDADEHKMERMESMDSVKSDEEVRPERLELDDISEASTWNEEEEKEKFDTWDVLRDEYAIDFGFDYNTERVTLEDVINDEDVGNTFKILGTSAEDIHSHPHVLSPPLMDAFVGFLPPELQGQNYWMRFSLLRDGASLETLKQYVRAAPFTILAIETPTGQVFGSFTSSPWRNHLGYFGGKPSFVWKMRHSRRSKCSSLFDQAQLESELDVYVLQDESQEVQVCHHDGLFLGGEEGGSERGKSSNDGSQNASEAMNQAEQNGFAIALDDDLMCGTTSPCPTFKSPALCGPGDKSQVFAIAGLEIWSFTPCIDVKAAEKLEMTKFFIEESARGTTHSDDNSSFGSRDLMQDRFYQRVGQDYESEERRQRWQYVNMMNPTDGTSRGMGATPRFFS